MQKEFEFDTEDEARGFTSQAIDFAISETKREIERTRRQIETQIKQSTNKLYFILNTEIRPIIIDAQERLTKAFNIQLSFPPLPTSEVPDSLKIDKSILSKESKYVNEWKTRKVMKRTWRTLFLWKTEVEEKYMVQKLRNIYVVSLKELESKINDSIEFTVNDIGQSTSKYFKEDFKTKWNEYCDAVEEYLAGYESSLKQALIDQQLKEDRRQELTELLNRIILESQRSMEHIDRYLKYVDKWMKFKQSSEVSYIDFKGAH